jgi:hypothetical protein
VEGRRHVETDYDLQEVLKTENEKEEKRNLSQFIQ